MGGFREYQQAATGQGVRISQEVIDPALVEDHFDRSTMLAPDAYHAAIVGAAAVLDALPGTPLTAGRGTIRLDSRRFSGTAPAVLTSLLNQSHFDAPGFIPDSLPRFESGGPYGTSPKHPVTASRQAEAALAGLVKGNRP